MSRRGYEIWRVFLKSLRRPSRVVGTVSKVQIGARKRTVVPSRFTKRRSIPVSWGQDSTASFQKKHNGALFGARKAESLFPSSRDARARERETRRVLFRGLDLGVVSHFFSLSRPADSPRGSASAAARPLARTRTRCAGCRPRPRPSSGATWTAVRPSPGATTTRTRS